MKPQSIQWLDLTSVGGGAQSQLATSHWPYDSFPEAPEVMPGSKTVLLEVEGPGVVSLFHVSKYIGGDQSALILRVFYDGKKDPAIEMPLMDFLGDVEAKTAYFSTAYFSHVKESHNFRLPMPFAQHIRIELENPTEDKFTGYTEIQWEKLEKLPEQSGYLHVAYSSGEPVIPENLIEICNIMGSGSIVAHWLQVQADQPECARSDLICEANHEIFLDGSLEPQLEYQGTEDLYGFSWGMGGGVQSDHYAAITRAEPWKSGGLFTMLRCRLADRIRFSSSCRWLMNYQQEYFSAMSTNPRHKDNQKKSFAMPYRSAVYYYL